MDLHEVRHIGGTTVRVGDCYIWAAIQYLDSATDYREHLPDRTKSTEDEDVVLLDDQPRPKVKATLAALIFLIPICLIMASLRYCG